MSRFNDLLALLRDMTHNRLENYIVPGVSSELVGGGEYGLVRTFSTYRDARDWVTPHSHRFNFTALVLAGRVHNTLFTPGQQYGRAADEWCLSTIDQVCGGEGIREYIHTRETDASYWCQDTTTYEIGDLYSMAPQEIHSIRFERGTRVLMFEGPQVKTSSVMLEPWVNGKCVPTFRTEPWMFEKVQP